MDTFENDETRAGGTGFEGVSRLADDAGGGSTAPYLRQSTGQGKRKTLRAPSMMGGRA